MGGWGSQSAVASLEAPAAAAGRDDDTEFCLDTPFAAPCGRRLRQSGATGSRPMRQAQLLPLSPWRQASPASALPPPTHHRSHHRHRSSRLRHMQRPYEAWLIGAVPGRLVKNGDAMWTSAPVAELCLVRHQASEAHMKRAFWRATSWCTVSSSLRSERVRLHMQVHTNSLSTTPPATSPNPSAKQFLQPHLDHRDRLLSAQAINTEDAVCPLASW